MRVAWALLKETFDEWTNDRIGRSAGALAFYMVFSLAPLLMIAVAVAGTFAGQISAQVELYRQVSLFAGPNAANFVQILIDSAGSERSGLIATVIGIGVSLFGASAIFVELQSSLNDVWGVRVESGSFWKQLLYSRIRSFLMVLGIGALVLVSLAAGAVLAAAQHLLGDTLPMWALVADILNMCVSFVLLVLMIAAIYKVLPDVQIDWRDVWVGATITAVLVAAARYGITIYLARTTLSSVYGAAGSLVIVLCWVFYSAQIFLFGAEFTQVYARRFGKAIRPVNGAVWLRSRAELQTE